MLRAVRPGTRSRVRIPKNKPGNLLKYAAGLRPRISFHEPERLLPDRGRTRRRNTRGFPPDAEQAIELRSIAASRHAAPLPVLCGATSAHRISPARSSTPDANCAPQRAEIGRA